MKVGILTFHKALNYGAVLQAFALNKKIGEMGHESTLIDYCDIGMIEQYKVSIFKKNISFKRTISNIITYIPRKTRYNKFVLFSTKFLNTTSLLITDENVLRKYNFNFDAYICGSDQVWNPEIYGDTVNPIYFLDFVSNQKAIKISYAASFGRDEIETKFYPEMKKYLENIKFLSVRENDGVNIIKKISGQDSQQVVDPVFLIKPEEWSAMDASIVIKKPYILIYLMESNLDLLKIAHLLSKDLSIEVINITPSILKYYCVDKNIMTAGPSDFVSLIKNASYVITNSFHATAFSIIFNRPFLTLKHSKWNSRMQSLLNTFGISTQMITKLSTDDPVILEKMFHYDTNKINILIEREIRKSIDFLKKALK